MKIEMTCTDCGSEVVPRCYNCDFPPPAMRKEEHEQLHVICGMDLANLMQSHGVENFELALDIIKRTEAAYAMGWQNAGGK